MIKCEIVYTNASKGVVDLEKRLNEIVDSGNKILFITSDRNQYSETFYTIIYEKKTD